MNYVAFTSTSCGIGKTKREAIKLLMQGLEQNNAEPTAFAIAEINHRNFEFGHYTDFDNYNGDCILILLDKNKGEFIEPKTIIL